MPTSIRLTPNLETRLSVLARKTGRTKAFYLREIIARGLEDVEDYYLAAEIARRVGAGEEKTLSSAEVRRELGPDD